jgi:hypothetical protein
MNVYIQIYTSASKVKGEEGIFGPQVGDEELDYTSAYKVKQGGEAASIPGTVDQEPACSAVPMLPPLPQVSMRKDSI